MVRRFRIPALLCALSVLLCELIAQPFTNMGVCDDGPYILMVQHLAATGHIVYNGGETAVLGWQLYLAAAFIKLFGFSFTAVRASSLLVSIAMAFLVQRCLVRCSVSERNATITTLAFVLSPLYLMQSAVFMSDIPGLFAIVLCLYGCLRALQASTSRYTVAWLCFAVLTNAFCGTSRQIAWLGILVMVPSTLWLLRANRRIVVGGAVATLAGVAFLVACMHWFSLQPYTLPQSLLPSTFPIGSTLGQLARTFLDIPFLLLPLFAVFLPQIRNSRPRILVIFSVSLLAYLALGMLKRHLHLYFPLEPTQRDWVDVHGMFDDVLLRGTPPILVPRTLQILLTILSFASVFGLVISSRHIPATPTTASPTQIISAHQLAWLLVPFTLAYTALLVPSAATYYLFDRYLLPLLLITTLCLARYYQTRIQPLLPFMIIPLVTIMAIAGIACTHLTFAFHRGREALAAELRTAGLPDTSVDNGWEYNFGVEIQQAGYINDHRIVLPAHAVQHVSPPPAGPCQLYWYDDTPHIHPLYSVSFEPNACYGAAPFAPVHYSMWPLRSPGTLYVVRYAPPAKP